MLPMLAAASAMPPLPLFALRRRYAARCRRLRRRRCRRHDFCRAIAAFRHACLFARHYAMPRRFGFVIFLPLFIIALMPLIATPFCCYWLFAMP